MANKEFICVDCGVDTLVIKEYYMLNTETWDKIYTGYKGMLCLGCAETRLGKYLQRKDFVDAPVNLGMFPRSDRFLNRMGIK